jgi:hypothetical protein
MQHYFAMQVFRAVLSLLCFAGAWILKRREDRSMSFLYALFGSAWVGVFFAPYL